MSHSKILPLAETAIAAALAYILSFATIGIAQLYYLEFAVIPIILLALRRGLGWGLTGGVVFGLLLLITGQAGPIPVKSAWLQYLDWFLEYLLAPASLGIAGFFRKKRLTVPAILLAAVTAALLKYFWHSIAAVLFWSSVFPKDWQSGGRLWAISFGTQFFASGIPTAIVAVLILLILYKANRKILQP